MVRGFCLVSLCFDFLLQIWVLLEIFLLDRFAHLFSFVSFTSLCQNFATFCDCSNLVTIECCFRYPWHQHFLPKLTKQPKSAAFSEAEPVNEGLPVKSLLHSDVSQTLRRMGGVPDDQSGWGKLGLGWMVHGFMRWWCLIGWEWFEHVPMIGSWGKFHSHEAINSGWTY